MRGLEPEAPSSTIPRALLQRNCNIVNVHCFKSLHFGINFYTEVKIHVFSQSERLGELTDGNLENFFNLNMLWEDHIVYSQKSKDS